VRVAAARTGDLMMLDHFHTSFPPVFRADKPPNVVSTAAQTHPFREVAKTHRLHEPAFGEHMQQPCHKVSATSMPRFIGERKCRS
jgi:hypothetical protein